MDESSTPDTSVDKADLRKEGATDPIQASSPEGYDQWQGRRLLFGLGMCTLFVVAAIFYEKCG